MLFDPITFDTEQKAPFTRPTPQLSTLLSHGSHFSVSVGRSMVADEHFLAQAMPVAYADIIGVDELCRPPWHTSACNLSECEKKDLAGNGIHAHVLGVMMLYVLCSHELINGKNRSWNLGVSEAQQLIAQAAIAKKLRSLGYQGFVNEEDAGLQE